MAFVAISGECVHTRTADVASQAACYMISLQRLHQRLGHPSEQVLKHLVNSDSTIGIPSVHKSPLPQDCMPCLQAKQILASHKTSDSRASSVLELLHVGLM